MLADLDQRFPIVDPVTGKASDYLMMLLQNNNLSNRSTDELLQELLARQIIAGEGLTGGGALGGPGNITIDADEQEILDAITTTQGSLLFRGATDWQALAPGTSGQFLKTLGAAADPQWATGGNTAWSLIGQTGSPTTGSTWTFSSNVTSVDVTGLGAYNDLMIVARGIVAAVSGNRSIQLGTGAGPTYHSTAGDYIAVAETGIEANGSAAIVHDTAATAARSLVGWIFGMQVAAPRLCLGPGTLNNRQRLFVANTNPITAIRLIPGGGGNITAGSLYVYAR